MSCPPPWRPCQPSRSKRAATFDRLVSGLGTCKYRRIAGKVNQGRCALPSSKIPLRRSRDREQVVAEVVVVVLGADEFLPLALLLAPARHHVHGLVDGAVVLDLDENLEESPVGGQLETFGHAELFAVRRAE